jgi:16S rRNA (cytosine967-C5)-methyltransferase
MAPSLPGGQGLASRGAALAVLSAVLQDGTTLDEALEPAISDLEPRDRAFSQTLVTTTLRRLGEIDGLINACLQHKLPKGAAAVRHILRLGIAQLVFLDLPPHAVLDTANRLAAADPEPLVQRLKGLVNGILRRITRERPRPLQTLEAGRRNTPLWLYRDWESAYGAEAAAEIAAQHMEPAPIDLTLKPGEDAAHWAKLLQAELLPTGGLRRRGDGALSALPGYDEGLWWVQDAAAALPVRLLGPMRGHRVLDLCAAPGGKTAQLASLGAEVTALDRSEMRLKRLRNNLSRLHLAAEVVTADALLWQPEEPFPLVLLDAPCSATGTLRRHPDLPHVKTKRNIEELDGLQVRLLDAATRLVAPGGTLLYCVCSLQKREGEERIAAFLAENEGFHRQPIGVHEAPGLEVAVTQEGDMRILPHFWALKGGIDGFFIARLKRLP